MAIRDVVTMGYGDFSRAELIPVLGYGLGTEYIPPEVPGIEFTAPRNALHFTVPRNALHFTVQEQ